MAQADYIISNQTFPNTRADINNHLSAIATNNSGTSAPTTQYAGQFWIDTTSSTWTLYIHDGSDDIQFATIDTSANTVNFTDSALDVVTDTTPQLGGNLDLNSNDITGTGNIDNVGTITTDGLTVAGNVSVDGGTIKLDGNYPVSTGNVALGDGALDDGSLTGVYNVAIGESALTTNTTGSHNTAVGYNSLCANTTGDFNVATGVNTLDANTTGVRNNAYGYASLGANTTGNNNTAFGFSSLQNNTTASYNTAIGNNALQLNTTGCQNIAIGYLSLVCNTTGNNNTAIGYSALDGNTTASNNTAVGYQSLCANTTGCGNTALGYASNFLNTTGKENTALGYFALRNNTTGCQNTAVGGGTVGGSYGALGNNTTGLCNTAVGLYALGNATTGSNNTAIGRGAGTDVTTGSNLTVLGYNAEPSSATATNEITLGDTNITPSKVRTGNGSILSNTPAFEAYRSTSLQSITDLTPTKVQFDTEVFDTDSAYDNTTNYRFTPQVAGKYFVYSGIVMIASTGTFNLSQFNIDLRKNGSTLRLLPNYHNTVFVQFPSYVYSVVNMNGTTDYVEIFVTTRSSTGANSNVDNTNQDSYFGAYKLIGV